MLLREGEMCEVIQIVSFCQDYFVLTKKYLEEDLTREQQITQKGIASDSRVESGQQDLKKWKVMKTGQEAIFVALKNSLNSVLKDKFGRVNIIYQSTRDDIKVWVSVAATTA